jgi:hypothetical protein
MTRADTAARSVHLARWTVTSGSNVQSRGAVVVSAEGHQWEASAEGNGAVDALFRAVDRALAEVLDGHPRLVAYDVHALGEGPDARGAVTLRIAPPQQAEGARATGEYAGEAQSENIIAASVDAYVEAINRMLGEEQWAGAAESAASQRRSGRAAPSERGRAEMDEEEAQHDTTAWFNR